VCSADTKDLTFFGHGSRYCLGGNLARRELRSVFDAVLDFLPPGSEPRDDLIVEIGFGSLRRVETLSVDFGS